MLIIKNNLFISATVLLLFYTAQTQGVVVSGSVISCCGTPIKGATVQNFLSGGSCITDADGKFSLDLNPENNAVRNNRILNENDRYDKLALYDLNGRCILTFDNTIKIEPQIISKIRYPSCYIAKLSNPQKQSYRKILSFSNTIKMLLRSESAIVPLGKRAAGTDSLYIRCAGFRSQSIAITSNTQVVPPINMTKTIDAFSECDELVTRSSLAIQSGTETLLDSLKLSDARGEWSANRFSVPAPDPKCYYQLNAKPAGFFSQYSITGNSGSYSKKVTGYAGFSGLELLKPALTKTGYVSGLVLSYGATIDSQSTVFLFMGDVMDSTKHPIYTVKKSVGDRPSLPFDSTILLEHYSLFQKEYEGYFSDSSTARQDTTFFTNQNTFPAGSVVIVNSHAKISGSYSSVSIVTGGSIWLQKDAVLRNCTIMAQKIFIDGGITDGSIFYTPDIIKIKAGTHNSQFFSCDSILVGKDVHTGSASLWVSKKSEENMPCIIFEQNKSLFGTAISFRVAPLLEPTNWIRLDSGSVFTGYLITNGWVEMKFVDITGSVYANHISASHATKTYQDFLIGVNLHAPQTPLLFPFIGKNPTGVCRKEFDSSIVCY